MDIAPACEVAKALGHSWPGLRWWMSLTAADQGAWASGIGALLAVMASVGLAWWTHFSSRREKRKAEAALVRIVSMQAQKPIAKAVASLGVVHTFLGRLSEGKLYGKPEILLSIRGGSGLTDLVQRATDLDGIPLEAIEAIAALEMAVTTYNEMLTAFMPMLLEVQGEDAGGTELSEALRTSYNGVVDCARDAVRVLGKHSARIASLEQLFGVGKNPFTDHD